MMTVQMVNTLWPFPVKPHWFYGSRAFLLSALSWIYDVREVHFPKLHFWVLIRAASSEPLGPYFLGKYLHFFYSYWAKFQLITAQGIWDNSAEK